MTAIPACEMIDLIYVRCPHCSKQTPVLVNPVLAYGEASASITGLHELMGLGETECDSQCCDFCRGEIGCPGEVIDLPRNDKRLIRYVPYGGYLHA